MSRINLTQATHLIHLHPFFTDQDEEVDIAYEKYRLSLNHPLKVARFAIKDAIVKEIALKHREIKL